MDLRERLELNALAALCARAHSSLELREATGVHLSRRVGADGFCFLQIDPLTALPMHAVEHHPPLASDTMMQVLGRSPCVEWGQLARRGVRVYRVTDLVDRPRGDPFIREMVLNLGYSHCAQVLLAHRRAPIAMLAVVRLEGRPDFSGDDLGFLAQAEPILSLGLRRVSMIEARSALPGEQRGAVLVAPSGEEEAVGGVARRALILVEPVRHCDDSASLMQLGLTARESQVAQGLLRGLTNEEAAQELAISRHTVAHHVKGIFDKLGVGSRRELAARLLSSGG